MTNTEHTPGKDDHRRPLTAHEVNLLQYKLQVAESRIVELEQERNHVLDKITQLEAAQRPRPMDEAPEEGTKLLECYSNGERRIAWYSLISDPGLIGWLPLPDQDEETP